LDYTVNVEENFYKMRKLNLLIKGYFIKQKLGKRAIRKSIVGVKFFKIPAFAGMTK